MAIQCKNCEFKKNVGKSIGQRGRFGRKWYFCENPRVHEQKDSSGFSQYNFIGYGSVSCDSPLQLKTAPKKTEGRESKWEEIKQVT